ncbi:MAG: hypothetical protein AAF528_05950 [Cyanobacteria bacterium P01_C01_bin.121]
MTRETALSNASLAESFNYLAIFIDLVRFASDNAPYKIRDRTILTL